MLKGCKNSNQETLVLRLKDHRSGLDNQQNECTKIFKGKEDQKKSGEYFVKRMQVNTIDPYEFFF